MSSFLLCDPLIFKSHLTRSGLLVRICVREDRGMSPNRQGCLREDRPSRIEGAHDSATMSGLQRPIRVSFGAGFVTPNKLVRVEEKPASLSSRGRASRPIGSPVEFSRSSAVTQSSSGQNGLSPPSVPGDPMGKEPGSRPLIEIRPQAGARRPTSRS
jgi:hypothetical protein